MRYRADPFIGVGAGTGARGFGLPPPSKFRSGHLPASGIPVSRPISGRADDSASASENDLSTDSEEDVYGVRYSLDSSPQQHNRVPNRSTYRYGNSLHGRTNNGSDYFFSDVSSSRETLVSGHRQMTDRMTSKNGRYPTKQNGFTEDDSSDSAASSEFSTTQVGSINGALPRNRASMASEGYSSSLPSRVNVGDAPKKVYISLKLLSL